MNKTILLAAAAAFPLTGGGAVAVTPSVSVHGAKFVPDIHAAGGAKILYSQNSNSTGIGLVSMNFTTFPEENSYGADDFIIPKKTVWTVTEVDASGVYYNGYGPATDENVIFYKDDNGVPGNAVKNGTFTKLNCGDDSGTFSCKLPRSLKLKSGHYWVSVFADMDSLDFGQWGWYISSRIHRDEATWENPGNGYGTGCTTWGTLGNCVGYSGDFMLDLQGKSKKS